MERRSRKDATWIVLLTANMAVSSAGFIRLKGLVHVTDDTGGRVRAPERRRQDMP
jgi:hypothetical protein